MLEIQQIQVEICFQLHNSCQFALLYVFTDENFFMLLVLFNDSALSVLFNGGANF
jgi:hypothetical protein